MELNTENTFFHHPHGGLPMEIAVVTLAGLFLLGLITHGVMVVRYGKSDRCRVDQRLKEMSRRS